MGVDPTHVSGGLRACVAPGSALESAIAGDWDPDHLLVRPDCRIAKLQPKVMVGCMTTAAGPLYVKRYNFTWRRALASLWRPSPAFAAWAAAHTLTACGFETPERVAAIEVRRAGLVIRSFFVTREVPGAKTADVRWPAILAAPADDARRTARRALARTLGDVLRRLHAAGVYHRDLNNVNLLVAGTPEAPRWVLVDLERVRVLGRLSRRRRVKNLVQLARTLGRQASATDRARFLDAYLAGGATGEEKRALVRAVLRRAGRKERRRTTATAPAAPGPTISCTVMCQDEEMQIRGCLESVAWCHEIVVVDGGSRDRTASIAREFTDRVVHNPWPGHRAQKQFALEMARGEWVLNLDADERVTPELAAEIKGALARVPVDVDGFAIPRLVCYLGRWWYRGGWYPRRVVRLIRRERARWGGTDPHERAEVTGRVLALRSPIIHHTYVDISDHLHSLNVLTTLAAEQRSVPGRFPLARLTIEPTWRLLRAYILRRGYMEGIPGFFVAASDAFYVFIRWAKVRERQLTKGRT